MKKFEKGLNDFLARFVDPVKAQEYTSEEDYGAEVTKAISQEMDRSLRGNPVMASRAEANQQAALFRLSADLAETLDESQIYSRTVKALHETLGYDFVAIFRYEARSGLRELESYAGYAEPHTPLQPGQGLSEAALDGNLHYTKDVRKHPNFYYGAGGSEVDAPIKAGDAVVGMLIAESKKKDDFDDVDLELLAAAATITGLAVEKARLLGEQAKRLAQLEGLRKTAQKLTAQLELAPLLHSILEQAAELLDAEGGEFGLVEEGGVRLVVSSNVGGVPERTNRLLQLGEGLMGQVVQSGEARLVEDYQRWPERLPEYTQIHSTMCVPLKLGDRIVGAFTTARVESSQPFNEDDLYLLNLFAQQAAVAVENARLYEQAQREIQRRRKAQEEVTRSKEYYKALMMNNPEAVVVADDRGNIISWNPRAEQLFGYTFEEVEGNNLDVFLAADAGLFDEARANTLRSMDAGGLRQTTQRTRKDGSFVDVELLTLPIVLNQQSVGFIAIYHDLTEIKRIENELRTQNAQMAREMNLAGTIQMGFMGAALPDMPGWDADTRLQPARQTSGDFFAIRELPDGQISVLIADVVDKGVGAALLMALTLTLFRVAPLQHGSNPSQIFDEINRRIIKETHSDQFLTAFYGVLDPATGGFTYCSAGHTPGYLFPLKSGSQPQRLIRTGMPLGIALDQSWEQQHVTLDDETMLLLYTDGITEGINVNEEAYGEARMLNVLRGKRRMRARQITQALLDSFHEFIGKQPQSDDIALILLRRAPQG